MNQSPSSKALHASVTALDESEFMALLRSLGQNDRPRSLPMIPPHVWKLLAWYLRSRLLICSLVLQMMGCMPIAEHELGSAARLVAIPG